MKSSNSRTSPSLLNRVKNPHDREAWDCFVDIYAPLLFYWARNSGLNHVDASDLVQDILLILVQKLPAFDYDQSKSFRGWLKQIAQNRAKNFHRDKSRRPEVRGDSAVANLASVESNIDLFELSEYRSFVASRALQKVQSKVQEKDWQAFSMLMIENQKADQVAQALGISTNSVYLAKSRILAHLRQELTDLWD